MYPFVQLLFTFQLKRCVHCNFLVSIFQGVAPEQTCQITEEGQSRGSAAPPVPPILWACESSTAPQPPPGKMSFFTLLSSQLGVGLDDRGRIFPKCGRATSSFFFPTRLWTFHGHVATLCRHRPLIWKVSCPFVL